MGTLNKKDLQIYGGIRAIGEMMKADSSIDDYELIAFGGGHFSTTELEKIFKHKLSKNYNRYSEEGKFVWENDENFFKSLETLDDAKIKELFFKLLDMGQVDGEFHDDELEYLFKLYENIKKIDNMEVVASKVTKIIKDWVENRNKDKGFFKRLRDQTTPDSLGNVILPTKPVPSENFQGKETNDESSQGVPDQNTLDKVDSLVKEYEELDRLEKKQFSSPSNGCLFIFIFLLCIFLF